MIYVYKCNNCDITFDKLTNKYNENTAECPHCGTLSNRIFSVSSINMKKWEKGLKQEQQWATNSNE